MPDSPSAGNPSEREWQFDALDLGVVERWIEAEAARPLPILPGFAIAGEHRVRRHVDTYYDTSDWRLGRAGLVLRERVRGARRETTVKNLVESSDGFRDRLEVSEDQSLEEAVRDTEGEIGRRVHSLVGRQGLRPIVEVRTRRQTFDLRSAGDDVAELALDESTMHSPGSTRRIHLRRVELESAGELEVTERVARAMQLACGLAPASLSKFEVGLLGAGLSIPGPADLGRTEVGPDSTIGEVALAALRLDARAMLAHEPGTRLGEDPEELHQMRVATRRLRAALGIFAEVLPVRAAFVREEIGWVASALGVVRDLDVQIERMAEWHEASSEEGERAGLGELVHRLEARRAAARTGLLEALDSRRYGRLVSSFTAMLRTSSGRRNQLSRAPAFIAMPDFVESRQRSVAKAVQRAKRSGLAPDFHRVRIQTKRLRYCIEFSAGLYGTPARRYLRQLAQLQTRLGSMQDAEVAAHHLEELALSDEGEPMSARAVFTVGGLASRYRAEARSLLAILPRELDALSGSGWRRLATAMGRERTRALAKVTPTRRWTSPRAPLQAVVEAAPVAESPAPAPPVEASPVVAPSVALVPITRTHPSVSGGDD